MQTRSWRTKVGCQKYCPFFWGGQTRTGSSMYTMNMYHVNTYYYFHVHTCWLNTYEIYWIITFLKRFQGLIGEAKEIRNGNLSFSYYQLGIQLHPQDFTEFESTPPTWKQLLLAPRILLPNSLKKTNPLRFTATLLFHQSMGWLPGPGRCSVKWATKSLTSNAA